MRTEIVVDKEHHDRVLSRIGLARVEVWIATATLKALFAEAPIGSVARARGRWVSIVDTLRELVGRGVDVRILHGAPPSAPFARALEKGGPRLAMRHCPRVHLKMIAIDGEALYLGSANLTGAGLGAKQEGRRNFEMGILTSDERALERAQGRYDAIWRGKECGGCKLRKVCPAPLDGVAAPLAASRARQRAADGGQRTADRGRRGGKPAANSRQRAASTPARRAPRRG